MKHINALKEEIEGLNKKDEENKQLMFEISQENKRLRYDVVEYCISSIVFDVCWLSLGELVCVCLSHPLYFFLLLFNGTFSFFFRLAASRWRKR